MTGKSAVQAMRKLNPIVLAECTVTNMPEPILISNALQKERTGHPTLSFPVQKKPNNSKKNKPTVLSFWVMSHLF